MSNGRNFLKTRWAFWFCLLAPFVITLLSFFKSPNEAIAIAFFSICGACLPAILANKAYINKNNKTGEEEK